MLSWWRQFDSVVGEKKEKDRERARGVFAFWSSRGGRVSVSLPLIRAVIAAYKPSAELLHLIPLVQFRKKGLNEQTDPQDFQFAPVFLSFHLSVRRRPSGLVRPLIALGFGHETVWFGIEVPREEEGECLHSNFRHENLNR